MSPQEPIAIIGIGCRFPGNGNTPSALWDLLREPPDLLTSVPKDRFSIDGFYHQDGQMGGHTNVRSSYFLEGNNVHRKFDAQFFGISPMEAHAIDPQVRMLLETVFEAVEDSGHTLSQIQGSDTAVYSGVLMHDYERIMSLDQQSMNRYYATGVTQSLIANRISYFFDLHGPSMVVDTACSASLYAVHLAIQQLRSGASSLAVATGCNLMLDPLTYVSQSKMNMLSPTGRSHMWDADANGYGRGEGIAAVVLKLLSSAEADGDPIHAVIRETGVNQDGKTPGITMPSSEAQIALIRDCYSRAGLDITRQMDRPQFFEAHGTGTPAGDPIEAEAISKTFFSNQETEAFGPLHVGGIKTIIGHTEGTAGLAGIIKVVLALRHATIPANLLFNRLNPRVEPFYKNLRIPTSALKWPAVPENQPRRASVNSFGFGGANAHAILESYTPKLHQLPETAVFSPFIFSAASEACLTAYLDSFRVFLAARGNELNMRNLAFTLHSRRTRFPYAALFTANSPSILLSKITERIEAVRSRTDEGLGVRAAQISSGGPRILAVFTGQGAQWAGMGAEIMSSSSAAKGIIDGLDARLARLPEDTRPSWTIAEELIKDATSSRINDPILAQPLSLAVQILLVNILEAAGVRFTAVVGHSSGELAAAYAAKRISAEDAICLSYYRGLSVASVKNHQGKTGAMLAVGTSQEDMEELLEAPEFKGRVWVAAVNSSASVTISGDSDAIEEIDAVLKDEKKLTKRLKVDRAYHSPHMTSCSSQYEAYQKNLSIEVDPAGRSGWFSSVSGENNSSLKDELKGPYWVENLISPVLFKQAVESACSDSGPFDMAIEIGPHPALKGPVQQVIQEMTDCRIPYTGLLQRGLSDLESLANGTGYIASHLGQSCVDLKAFEAFLSGDATFQTLQGLPPYSWNHSTEYWHESRYAHAISHRSDTVHELLGHPTPDSSDREMRWRHSICPKEVPWLSGHCVQGQKVFPGAAFIVMVLEACLKLAKQQPVSLIEIVDMIMGQALTFDDDDTPVEVVFTLTDIQKEHEPPCIKGKFNCSTSKSKKSDALLDSLAYGEFRILLGAPSTTALPGGSSQPTSLVEVDPDDFYASLINLDYEFSGPFKALSCLRRKLGLSTGFLSGANTSSMMVHPAMLDALLQSIILAASAPNDGRLWAAHIPNHIDTIRFNPLLCDVQRESKARPAFEASCEQTSNTSFILGSCTLFPEGSKYSMIAVEGVKLVAISRATAENDRVMFSSHSWGPVSPDISKIHVPRRSTPGRYEFTQLLQRAAFFYLRKLQREVPQDHPSRFDGPYTAMFQYASHTLRSLREGEWSLWHPDWETDIHETIEALLASRPPMPDSELLQAMGPRLADIVTENASAIDIGMEDDLLARFYQGACGMTETLDLLAKTVGQIVHRHPRLRCLEVGAGTGMATRAILRDNGFPFAEYTFTDISSGFFASAQRSLGEHADRIVFKPLDISNAACVKGFEAHSYDLIIASLVLHATPCLRDTLKNVRRLLKPGGYLIAIELQKNIPAHIGSIFGAFPGWWLGADDGRVLSPCVDVEEWDNLLRLAGFSGCDSSAFQSDPLVHPATIFLSQAVDERVDFLRNPFTAAVASPSSGITIPRLVFLGGRSAETSSLVSQLTTVLEPYCTNVVNCRELTESQSLGIDSETFVLSLVDLDEPLFHQLAEDTWESLKNMLQRVGSLVWVTQGRCAAKPHSNMMVGIMRSILNEIPNITTQFLDFEDGMQLDAKALGTAVLQFAKLVQLKQEDRVMDMTHTIEPELSFQKAGTMVIPRLKKEQEMNNRYNSSRRVLSTTIPTAQASIGLGPAKPGYYVRQRRADALESAKEATTTSSIVRVSHSLLMPMRLNRHSSLFWSLGVRTDTLAPVIALSLSNEAVVCPEVYIPVPVDAPTDNIKAGLFQQVVLLQICALVLEDVEDGDRVLIHDAEPALAELIQAEGQRRGVDVVCTTTQDCISDGRLQLHSNGSERSIQALRPESLAVLADFGVTGESRRVSQRILRHVNAACRRETVDAIFGSLVKSPTERTKKKVRDILQDALAGISDGRLSFIKETDVKNLIKLADIDTIKGHLAHRYIVDWTIESQVPAVVEPIDAHPLFSRHKTYWLVGLTGSLGLSLCEWMIRKGARHIAISSRNPKVEPGWLEMIARLGAVVKVNSCDVVNMHQLQTAHEDICSSMPPIAGVAQGAMVLHDTGFHAMSLDHLQKVTRPKVEGSVNLDKIFQDKQLDFFIYLSSVTSIVGTPGQAAYSAANLFMTSLAEQQRQRGLPTAVINIGPVIGAGYIMRPTSDIKPLILLGLRPLSERDFHLLVAEAVVACRTKTSGPIDITMGIKQARSIQDMEPKWATNPIMSHWIQNSGQAETAAKKSTVSLKEQLLAARTKNEVSILVRGAILNKFVALLRLDFNKNTFDDTVRLDDLGIDSLMATEVRLLIMSSFRTNVPVLRILSGISFKDLVAIVLDNLDPSMAPNVRMESAADSTRGLGAPVVKG